MEGLPLVPQESHPLGLAWFFGAPQGLPKTHRGACGKGRSLVSPPCLPQLASTTLGVLLGARWRAVWGFRRG